jgi:hypothetical protein
MSMLSIHKDAIESHRSLFHEFLSQYNKTEKRIYGFVEGKEDPSFYRGAIEHYIPEDWDIDLRHAGNKIRSSNYIMNLIGHVFPNFKLFSS